MYNLAIEDKIVAAQVFLVTLEWEGDYTGNFCTTSKEAMGAMLALAKKWVRQMPLRCSILNDIRKAELIVFFSPDKKGA